MLPDFVIIGAQKAATTSTYSWLVEHPYVRGATRKEIDYFADNYHRGLDWYRRHFPLQRDRERFAAVHGRPFITGEASPFYMTYEETPSRMASVIADVKLIVQLRNPIDRAYSQYQMNRRKGIEPVECFADALALENPPFRAGGRPVPRSDGTARKNWHYLHRGHYADLLDRWSKYFAPEQFHILTTDDLARDPAGTVAALEGFLGLPPLARDRFAPRHTASYPPLPDTIHAALAEYFRPHNERLYELLGRELGWDTARQ
ncbi:MAG: sulfotransferase domain-containing protein [Actinomycetota bacterium]|nr:sulfotransferase domain-containing protein [Actinomycetota bacterium]